MRLDFEGVTMPNIGKELLSSHKKVNVSTSLWMELKLKIVWLEMKGINKSWICKEGRLKGLDLKGSEFEKV